MANIRGSDDETVDDKEVVRFHGQSDLQSWSEEDGRRVGIIGLESYMFVFAFTWQIMK